MEGLIRGAAQEQLSPGSREAQHAAHPVLIIAFTLLAEELRIRAWSWELGLPAASCCCDMSEPLLLQQLPQAEQSSLEVLMGL